MVDYLTLEEKLITLIKLVFQNKYNYTEAVSSLFNEIPTLYITTKQSKDWKTLYKSFIETPTKDYKKYIIMYDGDDLVVKYYIYNSGCLKKTPTTFLDFIQFSCDVLNWSLDQFNLFLDEKLIEVL